MINSVHQKFPLKIQILAKSSMTKYNLSMKEETIKLIEKLRDMKQILMQEGFVIDGLFGSYARGDFSKESDVDILYHVGKPFMQKYQGFAALHRLDEIKKFLSKELKKKIDLAPKNSLSRTGKQFILPEVLSL